MRRNDQYDRNEHNRPQTDPQQYTASVLVEAALVFAFCFLFASYGPRELVATTLGSLLFIAAIVAVATAQIRGEPVQAKHITNWDVAAAFVLLSIACSWLADPDAIRSYIDANAQLGASRPR